MEACSFYVQIEISVHFRKNTRKKNKKKKTTCYNDILPILDFFLLSKDENKHEHQTIFEHKYKLDNENVVLYETTLGPNFEINFT